MAKSNPKAVGSWLNERGDFGIGSGLIIGASLLSLFVGLKFGNPFKDNNDVRAQVKQCIDDVTQANEDLAKEREQLIKNGEDPAKHKLAINDASVQKIVRCQTLLARIANDQNHISGLKDKELTSLIPQALGTFAIGKCSMNDPPVGTAGVAYNGTIVAQIPFDEEGARAVLNMTGEVGGQSDNFHSTGNNNWQGTIGISAEASANAATKMSSVNVVASSPAFDIFGKPFIPGEGIPCPEGSTIQPGTGICQIVCNVSKSFTWSGRKQPEIVTFTVNPTTINEGETADLHWEVKDALTVSIDHGIGRMPISGSAPAKPQEDTEYTLTAIGAGLNNVATPQTVTLKVNKCPPPDKPKNAEATLAISCPPTPTTVTITSPSGNAKIADSSVTVSGTVSPAPSSPLSVKISGGSQELTAPVDSSGNFSGAVALQNVFTQADLSLTNPSLSVGGCGNRSTPVTVGSTKSLAAVTNVITVTVTDGTTTGASSSVTVFHAVHLDSFTVRWLSCDPFDKDEPLNTLLGAGESALPGTVECGCNNADDGCHETCSVQATVGTSLGSLQKNATWTFNVKGPCP